MLLPRRYNAGGEIPSEPFGQTREDLLGQFGAISARPGLIQGIWTYQGQRYEDELVCLVVDVDDTAENRQFFIDFKTVLLERFEQIEIYIASYPIDIL